MTDQKDNEPAAENTPPLAEKAPQNPAPKGGEPKDELEEGDLDQVVGGTAGFKFF